jgi:diguanylate cyclase (GGDEF)-like protein
VALFAAISIIWGVLAWLVFEQQVQKRTAQSVAQQTAEVRQNAVIITANVDRVFSRLQGLAAVVAGMSEVRTAVESFAPAVAPSSLEYDVRKSSWTHRADLLSLSRQMLTITRDIGVDIIWVMNASGDCIAASNTADATSFVGTNYRDRAYFTSAQAGERGRQFAVGRVTKVPGLFFSAPVIANGRFLGAVAVKNDLPRIAAALNHPNAFVTDDHGVIILAADPRLEMRALPGAAVHHLSERRRLSRYLRLEFDTYGVVTEREPGALLAVAGSPYPHIGVRRELPQHGIAVHILMPVRDIESLRSDAALTFLLLLLSALLLTALAFGARIYMLRLRQHRKGVEATNESLTRLNAQLEDLATVDPLTGLYNRRFMDESLEREVIRANRKQMPLAVIMIDIDHFKSFNDTFGHAAGDVVLRAAGGLMKRNIRASDIVCRYGGEEFLVVLPEAGVEIARERAEALRRAMQELTISHEGKALGEVTISLGIAMFPQHGSSVAELVAAADAALYDAKNDGRNRLVSAEARRVKSSIVADG